MQRFSMFDSMLLCSCLTFVGGFVYGLCQCTNVLQTYALRGLGLEMFQIFVLICENTATLYIHMLPPHAFHFPDALSFPGPSLPTHNAVASN